MRRASVMMTFSELVTKLIERIVTERLKNGLCGRFGGPASSGIMS